MTVNLHYQTYGQGNPVLILHGLFGSSRNWTVFARKLALHYQVLTVDLRNHGNSGHTATMSYREMAADIQQFLQSRGYNQASIIGHSMGGKVAMTFALTYPSMIDRLIVLDTAPVAYCNNRNNFHVLIDSLEALPLTELTGRKHADELLTSNIPDIQLRLYLLQNLVQDGAGHRWRINLSALKQGLAELSHFPAFAATSMHTGASLFLGGSDSDHLQPRHHEAIFNYFREAQIEIIDEAGHWLHIDQPEAVLNRIVPFLR
ncbi:MAG: AB hydrolase-1 protein [Gammaproteobacteria bacterium]|nr:AB hydrolase-1 protein [Gammaproteobacteria bacterium]